MNSKQREITGWAMYDWANSAFSATVVTVLLGPYLAALINARPGGVLVVGGYAIEAEAFYPFCVSISVVLQVLFLPVLGTLADHTNLKKGLMMLFAYLGAVTTILLYFVQSGSILLGGLLFIIANLSFGAAIVFYNAFLPDIANPDEQRWWLGGGSQQVFHGVEKKILWSGRTSESQFLAFYDCVKVV